MKLFRNMLLLAILLSPSAFADGFSASLGGDYSTGKYGSNSSTNVFYMPFQANYETGAFTYRLTVPWIRVTGDGNIVPGGLGGSGGVSSGSAGTFGCATDNRKGASKPEDNGPCAGVSTTTTTTVTTTNRTTESGLGDIVAAITYNLINGGDSGFVVDLTGRIKFPTASESRGLGSGKADYAAQLNVDKNFAGGAYLSAGLGYRVLGEPSGITYDNVTYGSLGGGYKFSKDTSVGVSYDWATAAVDGATRPQEVSIYASHFINDNYKISGVIYAGLSNANPDVGGGLALGYYF
jgi:Putative MetA-pathway of phenol degradation